MINIGPTVAVCLSFTFVFSSVSHNLHLKGQYMSLLSQNANVCQKAKILFSLYLHTQVLYNVYLSLILNIVQHVTAYAVFIWQGSSEFIAIEYEMSYKYNVLLLSDHLMHMWHSRARYLYLLTASHGEVVPLRTLVHRSQIDSLIFHGSHAPVTYLWLHPQYHKHSFHAKEFIVMITENSLLL